MCKRVNSIYKTIINTIKNNHIRKKVIQFNSNRQFVK